jgi:hypothetical protein
MAFEASVMRVLIASPGDVGEERNVIPEIINEWNAVNAIGTKVVLMPVKWEVNAAPMLGDRPQEVINKQIVRDCDMLVGMFWTRIGTSTGAAVSGTAEEIEEFICMKKPVMLYFSQALVDPELIDLDQFSKLKGFKEKMRLQGLTETYQNIPDFRQKFVRQLGINVNTLLSKKAPRSSIKEPSGGSSSPRTRNRQQVLPVIPMSNEEINDEKIDETLRHAVNVVADDTGWARMGAVGHYLRTYTLVDFQKLGFQKLKPFIVSREIFEIKEDKGHPIVRVKPATKPVEGKEFDEVVKSIERVVTDNVNQGRPVYVSFIGITLRSLFPSFDYRKYGAINLSEFISSTGLFEIRGTGVQKTVGLKKA